jgi:hypothetical protein
MAYISAFMIEKNSIEGKKITDCVINFLMCLNEIIVSMITIL